MTKSASNAFKESTYEASSLNNKINEKEKKDSNEIVYVLYHQGSLPVWLLQSKAGRRQQEGSEQTDKDGRGRELNDTGKEMAAALLNSETKQ